MITDTFVFDHALLGRLNVKIHLNVLIDDKKCGVGRCTDVVRHSQGVGP